MKFANLSLEGAMYIESEQHGDERGFFSRCRCIAEFSDNGLPTEFVQTSLCHNIKEGTFRGLHFQAKPSAEGKLVRCVRGAVHDIVVDLRPESTSFLHHEVIELSAEGGNAVYIPPGVAHGYLTLTDDATLFYEMTDYHAPELARGVRHSDPALGIKLPGTIRLINDRDANYADIDVDTLRFTGEAGA